MNPQTNGHINPNAARLGRQAPTPGVDDAPRLALSLTDLTSLTIRLAHILADEVDCLEEMRIKDIEAMQEEKSRLIRVIGAMKKEMDRNPNFQDECSEEEVESFKQVSQIFGRVMEENHRRLLVAKEINGSIVKAISDVVREEAQRAGYNRSGKNGMNHGLSPSVSLNKTI